MTPVPECFITAAGELWDYGPDGHAQSWRTWPRVQYLAVLRELTDAIGQEVEVIAGLRALLEQSRVSE